jgi:catechol 2,3-dioxygenase-like lactoylglutathione lyase family enzyme
MINAVHTLIFSENPEADRAFLRDVLGFPNVDAGGGWLIFKLPPGEAAVHPGDGEARSELYFMCDDIKATVAELTAQGVEVAEPFSERRYGIETSIRLPGGSQVGLYEPRHPVAYDLAG